MSMYKGQGRAWGPLFLCIGREEHGKVGEGSGRESTRLSDDKVLRVRASSLSWGQRPFSGLCPGTQFTAEGCLLGAALTWRLWKGIENISFPRATYEGAGQGCLRVGFYTEQFQGHRSPSYPVSRVYLLVFCPVSLPLPSFSTTTSVLSPLPSDLSPLCWFVSQPAFRRPQWMLPGHPSTF